MLKNSNRYRSQNNNTFTHQPKFELQSSSQYQAIEIKSIITRRTLTSEKKQCRLRIEDVRLGLQLTPSVFTSVTFSNSTSCVFFATPNTCVTSVIHVPALSVLTNHILVNPVSTLYNGLNLSAVNPEDYLAFTISLYFSNLTIKTYPILDSGTTNSLIDSQFAADNQIPLIQKSVPIPLNVIDWCPIASGCVSHYNKLLNL
ncbi:hypothetical protein BB561_002975 [Smittium simulii]|uniref:Uncharacterized protein n=1 Tax=Smittium simulii TaxID=133385 RepID=A0A2T9YNK6_9FUNG|nr:hypothetical protein BB561_002975 [Smittium simulii]